MKPLTLSEMREVLERGKVRLTKSLGQNFLHDCNQLRRIVHAADLQPGERVLEIGPGLGPLTAILLEERAEVFAIEKDARLVEFLKQHFQGSKNLTLLHADALDLLQRERRDWSDWKLVSNLPYSVASAILVEIAQKPTRPKRIVATLQLEVAARIMAEANDDDYGLITLLLQLRYQPIACFKIPAGCFFPAPDVDSACVTLDRREKALLPFERETDFERIVRRAFSQRRKMMFKLLKEDWPEDNLHAAFKAAGIAETVRAEAVGLDGFVKLTRSLAQS